MGMGKTLRKEITEWGILTMVIVIISLVLLTMKSNNIGNSTCGGSEPFFNVTANLCCNGTTSTGLCQGAANQSAILTTGSFIDTVVVGLSEPKNWLIIVIVGLIGFALVKLFSNKNN